MIQTTLAITATFYSHGNDVHDGGGGDGDGEGEGGGGADGRH